MGKSCPPFCPPDCAIVHDSVLVSLLHVQEGNPVTLDEFEEEAEKLFKAGFHPEDPIADPNPEYEYPLLHWAVVLGKYSVVQFLVDRGHSPCIQSREKSETPLHRAVHCLVLGLKNFSDSQRFKRFRQILHVLSPAIGMQDDSGDTALHLCAKYITEYYLQNYLNYYKDAMESLITVVVETERTDVFDIQNKDGNTLLHIFAQTHNELCFVFAKKLLKLGAAFNVKNKEGQQCTDIARKCSYRLFMYIDSRKRKLRKRKVHSLSHSKSYDETEILSGSEPEKKIKFSSNTISVLKGIVKTNECSTTKTQPLPSFKIQDPYEKEGEGDSITLVNHHVGSPGLIVSAVTSSTSGLMHSLSSVTPSNSGTVPSTSVVISSTSDCMPSTSGVTSLSSRVMPSTLVVLPSISGCKPSVSTTTARVMSCTSVAPSSASGSIPSTSGANNPSSERANVVKLPHTPPHMPGDLEQDEDEQIDVKYGAVSELFNDLLNSDPGKLSGSVLHSKGGILKALLKQSGQINALINETRKIVSEKGRELEDCHAIQRRLVQEQEDSSRKCKALEHAVEIKKRELVVMEESLRKTKTRSSKLLAECQEQEESIARNEQLITTLGQIVAILEND